MRLRKTLVGTYLLVVTLFLTGCYLFQPQALIDFAAPTVEGPQPLVVSFEPIIEGTPISVAWDFGDGNTSDELDPVHIYKAAGTFTVTLTVELAGGGLATTTKTDYVTVSVRLAKEQYPLVYWVNDRGVLKSGGRGGIGEEILAEWVFGLSGMAIADNKLFWLDDSQSIVQANLDGTQQETVLHGRELYYLPSDIAVDPVRKKVYWTCIPHDTPVEDAGDRDWVWIGGIYRANLDGSNIETLITYPSGASEYASDIVVDPVLGRIYWCLQGSSSWKLRSSPMGSWNPQTMAENSGIARSLALDTISPIGARYVYYIQSKTLQQLRISGGSPVELMAGLSFPRDTAVDLLEGKLYVATDDGIVRANVNGTEKEIIFPEESVRAMTLR